MAYRRITPADRYRIQGFLESGFSRREIARRMKRAPSTIVREIDRMGSTNQYSATMANELSQSCKKLAKKKYKIRGLLKSQIVKYLLQDWSPEQISAYLKSKKRRVSKQTIYKFIERERGCRNDLIKHLRILRKEQHDRKKVTWRPHSERLTKRTWIDERPKIVEKRTRIGDFERDTVFGKLNGPLLLTIVDRTSRYAKLEWVEKKCSILIHKATVRALKNEIVKTITNDNGTEFVKHELTAQALKTEIYFSKAYRAWERGTNENFNGLLRQYFPRKKCIGNPGKAHLKKIERLLNTRPRKVLGWKTPLEVHRALRSKVLR